MHPKIYHIIHVHFERKKCMAQIADRKNYELRLVILGLAMHLHREREINKQIIGIYIKYTQ